MSVVVQEHEIFLTLDEFPEFFSNLFYVIELSFEKKKVSKKRHLKLVKDAQSPFFKPIWRHLKRPFQRYFTKGNNFFSCAKKETV